MIIPVPPNNKPDRANPDRALAGQNAGLQADHPWLFSLGVAHLEYSQKPKEVPSVKEILIAETPTSPMASRSAVRAVPGRGLEGDRYFIGAGTFSPNPQKPDFQITLIEKEKVEEFARDFGLPFTTSHAR